MIGEPYSFLSKTRVPAWDGMFFTFLSTGRDAIIPKGVAYIPIEKNGSRYYNFGFGDLVINPITGKYDDIDDKVESNNGDVVKVFYTVVSTLTDFFEQYPDATVHVAGSDRQRMDVYQKLIVRHWKEIEPIYYIQGFRNKNLENFQPIRLTMQTLVKKPKNGLTSEKLTALQQFIDKVHAGEVKPFKKKTEQARKNLKKAGLIK